MSQALKSKNEDESGSGEWRVEIGEQQSSKEAREERERVDEE